jgi:hypothetical protein
MNPTPDPQGPVDPALDEYEYEDDDGFGETLPVRPKRPFLTKWSAALMALILGAVGFFVGVRVEKDKIPATSGAGSAFAGGAAGTGRGASAGTGAAGSFASRFAAGAGGAGGVGGAAGNETVGSVASVNGKTLYVTETSGNTVKVKLSRQTAITKSESVSSKKVFPGDEVVVAGAKGSGGTVSATSLTDSGARATSSTNSSSTSGGSSSSVVSSLFGS